MIFRKNQVIIGYTEKMFSDGIAAIIGASNDYTVVDKIPVKNGLYKVLKEKNRVDILIIELNCPGQKDLDYVLELLDNFSDIKVLLISHLAKKHISSKLIGCGIDAYLLKSCSKHDLFTALNKLVEHQNYYCSDITKTLLGADEYTNQPDDVYLTSREKEVLTMLVNCQTNAQIAENIGLSENTVKTHRRNILAKFGVNNIIGMVRYACKTNLIDFGKEDFCMICPHCKSTWPLAISYILLII